MEKKKNKNSNGKHFNKKQNDRTSNVQTKKNIQENRKEQLESGVLVYTDSLSVGELAEKLGKSPTEIVKFLFLEGKMVTINSTLDDDLIGLVCLNYGFDFKKEKES